VCVSTDDIYYPVEEILALYGDGAALNRDFCRKNHMGAHAQLFFRPVKYVYE
jgi:hypothetical protein